MFNDDRQLRRALKRIIFSGKFATSDAVRNSLSSLTRTAANFRPNAALSIYRKFNAKSVLDPCMGWGGRMFGAMAAGIKYVGIDPSSYAIAGNREFLSDMTTRTGKKFAIEILQGCAEDILNFETFNEIDLVFTSPPYFDTEQYSEELTQSYLRYPTKQLWLENFLRPMIRGASNSLISGGHFIINVSDDLVEKTKQYMMEIGLTQCEHLQLELTAMPYSKTVVGKCRYEPVLVFKK